MADGLESQPLWSRETIWVGTVAEYGSTAQSDGNGRCGYASCSECLSLASLAHRKRMVFDAERECQVGSGRREWAEFHR